MIPLSYYQSGDVVQLARALLGKSLFTRINGELTGGIIIETEAYAGAQDKACHSYNNRRTPRNEPMFAAGGIAYVYLCYGIHHLLNIITGAENDPVGILLRAIQPTHGIETMLRRRGHPKLSSLASGPGSLTQALGVTLQHNKIPLDSPALWLEEGPPPRAIEAGPRIGVAYAGEDALLPYRFQSVACEITDSASS